MADRRGRGRLQTRGGGRSINGRGGKGDRGGASPIRIRAPPATERPSTETAPPGSPIADRLMKPTGPVWANLTPAQAAIQTRLPPQPTQCITPPVVTGHVKEPEGPRTRAHRKTGPRPGSTLLPRDTASSRAPRPAQTLLSEPADPAPIHTSHTHAHTQSYIHQHHHSEI